MTAPELFDQPALWRVEAATALGLTGEELIAAVSPGPAFPEALRALALALPHPPRCIIDLGAGGGGPSEWFRIMFGATVYAVEPTRGARQAARRSFPALHVVAGRADSTPLPGGVADVVVLSGVLSLIDDVQPVVKEVERLLARRGSVAIADLFSGDSTTWSSSPNVFRSFEHVTRTLRADGFTTEMIGCGEPFPGPSWSAVSAAVDEWIDAHCTSRHGYETWRRDQRRLQDHARAGRVIAGCIAAARPA